jgi:hypothetical protein
MREANSAANTPKITITGQRDGNRSRRPRQNSTADMNRNGAISPDDSTVRNGTLVANDGSRLMPSHNEGPSTIGLHSGRRRSKARAPCQQQANEAISAATPMPMLTGLVAPKMA